MSDQAPIIIKKIKKGGGHGHHGGAWKVAYADFVTAMMAFFLLMWLLNATSEEQKRGISNYFGPYGNAAGSGGSGGLMGGLSIATEGMYSDNKEPMATVSPSSTYDPDVDQGEGHIEEGIANENSNEPENPKTGPEATKNEMKQTGEADKAETLSEKEKKKAEALLEKYENQLFSKAEQELKNAITSDPALKELSKNLIIENTPEGLRIQIVDASGLSMFPDGSPDMFDHTRKLLEKVTEVIKKMPNEVSISGHTDSKPFSNNTAYGNWELSTDRANASRRVLSFHGVEQKRIKSVVGKADTEPLVATNPESAQNRRISIVLLRQGAGAMPLKDLPKAAAEAKKALEKEDTKNPDSPNKSSAEVKMPPQASAESDKELAPKGGKDQDASLKTSQTAEMKAEIEKLRVSVASPNSPSEKA